MSRDTDMFLKLCKELPGYCTDFFAAKSETLELKTRTAYAGDLKVFFDYLIREMHEMFPYDNISMVPLSGLDALKSTDIDQFMMYLSEYTLEDKTYTNSSAGKKRKLATLKTFFKYFTRTGRLSHNPAEWVETPKIKEKEIVILSEGEQIKLLNAAERGINRSARGKSMHEKKRFRDFAILATFLGTGLRVSELVGINDYDLDLEQQRFLITRKGGKRQFVYFNADVLDALCNYIDYERNSLLGDDFDGDSYQDGPLFLSLKHQRISVRQVQVIIKRYASFVLPPNMKVTPHTLRKTFGTEAYRKYKDLYLVQNALGHSSPATTAKFYAQFDPEYLKQFKDDN